ncbi:hypothetical protein Tco_0886399 [Tanacetum coccineum]
MLFKTWILSNYPKHPSISLKPDHAYICTINALVDLAGRFEFEKCNMRLKTDIKPMEATFQVVLDALTLTPFYQAFLITTEVLAIYMQDSGLLSLFISHLSDSRLTRRNSLSMLKHYRDIHYITDVSIDYLHQPWRAFATIINKCLSGKDTAYEKICLSQNKNTKKTNKMLYPRFTKVIIDYFMSKDQSISRRNKMFWHTARDDTMFTSMRCVSTHEKTQVYCAILPQHLTNQAMLESIAYQTYYAYASGEKAPKEKLKSLAKVAKTDKKQQPAMMPKTKGLTVLSEVALTEAEQIKLATKISKTQFHSSHASGSSDGVDTQSKVSDEQQQKVSGTNEGAGVRPDVPDVPKYDSENNEESCTFSQDEEDVDKETDVNDDSKETKSDNDGDDLTHPNLVSTPPEYELTEEEKENKKGDDKDKEGEHEQDEEDDMYKDVNINLERSDAEMTDAQVNKDTEDAHMTLTVVPPVVQQQRSSVSSDLVSKFINPSPDTAVSSIPGIVDNYIASKMKETVDVPIQLQTNKLREEAQAENHEFLNQILIDKMEENKSIDRSDVQKDLYKTLVESYNSDKDIISSYGKEAESSKEPTHKESKSTSSSKGASKSQPKSSGKSAQAEEHGQKVDDLEEHSHQEFNTGNDDVIPVREILEDASQWNPPSSLTPDHEWHKTKTADKQPP